MTHDPARPQNAAVFLREMQRRDFLTFLDRAWPYISGGQLLARNWHIDAMACRLDRVKTGRSRRLLINLPPRNAKSKTVSVIWVAWMLGQDPTLNFVCVSYSNELSGKLARDCLTIMLSPWYRELFPRTIIRRSASHDFETSANGGRLATSVTGSLTGRGGDIIILDDVIKPDEASSEVTREAVNTWYRSTLASRLNDKESGAIICVMQRLHQFDLPGMLLEAGAWDHLALPAIATEDEIVPLTRGRRHVRRAGDVLHPERESRETLDRQLATMGSSAFAAQYQQAPVPALGNIFKASWLKSYDAVDANEGGEIVQSWDTGIKTAEGNSFSVCITALVRQRHVYILDVWRGRLEFPDLRKKAIELARLHSARTLLIEDRASGSQLIQTLRSEEPAGVPLPIACQPDSDKRTRAEGVSSMVEAGQLLVPGEAHWLGEFKSELLSFPSGRYDDQVDALSQLLARVRNQWTDQVPDNVGPALWVKGEGWTGEGAYVSTRDYSDIDPWGA
jgi:predicted phage terminase large subunit-like protein